MDTFRHPHGRQGIAGVVCCIGIGALAPLSLAWNPPSDRENAATRPQAADASDDAVAAETAYAPMVVSERQPWEEAMPVVSASPNSGLQPTKEGLIPLPPAPDGTLSVLVHFDPAVDGAARAQGAVSAPRSAVRDLARGVNARVEYEYDVLPNVVNVRGLTAKDVDALRRMPGVVKVENDYEVTLQHNDSMPLIRAYQSQLQGAGFTGVDGSGVRVCVIDTGIDSNSIMYSSRIDAAAGWDFVNNDSNPEDDNGHGSHVSGTVLGGFVTADFACVSTGPESMQGVAPAATLIGVKVLNASGSGSASNIIAGINRCASTSLPGGQADVINMSLGGGQFTSTCDTDTMAQAVNNAVAAGVTVVCAAGNNGYANSLSTPACASGAIAVAATYDDTYPSCDFPSQTSFSFCLDSFCLSTCTDNSPVVDQRCCFSNRSTKIDVAAPGCIIFSNDSTVAAGNGLVGFCGTSQASPHVAGLAALLIDLDPTLTPAEVRQLIRDGAIDKGAAGFDTSYGWGRIDVINSLTLAQPPVGCTSNPECDDGLFCNGAETCVSNACQPGTAPNCSDGVACTTDTCNEATDSCDHTANNAACSDGLFCNGSETCHVTLGCQAGTAPDCADSVACTTDSCNETTDTCDHTPNNAACDDGLFCNGAETCNVTLGCQAGSDPCGGAACDEGTDTCAGSQVWISFVASTAVPSVGTVGPEDIVSYNTSSGTWSLVFDGSDVGLSGLVIDGLARTSAGEILLSFTVSASIAGMTGGPSGTTLDDSDIVRFVPTSLGANTAGSFVFYFDGSDVGLTTDNEDVDAIALAPDGRLVISTLGSFTATGASGDDKDLVIFTATSLGSVTSGSFAVYFDASDVGLTTTSEDVDAVAITPTTEILLSTIGNFNVTGVSGANEDIFKFTPTSLGSTTAGSYTMLLDLSTLGIATGADVGGAEWVP